MEEESHSIQTLEKVEEDDDFYENLEAPKFVDLNAPDHYHPGDDRYWFCLRVGCDQNHEEEMDSETIYKNFVLRVMAARSPNIRLRKALYRKESSITPKKCPQTVPAKPSKPRVAKLALISSISKRIPDLKIKVKPISNQRETLNMKGKQSSSTLSKAMTTPRNKKRLSNPNAFRSVRHLKPTATAAPKSRAIAKTLVFHSPKKERAQPSLELNTPVKTLCEAMKKLEINTGKKHMLAYNRQLPSEVSRKQLRGREVKSRVYEGLRPKNPKGPEVKTSKCLKKNTEKNLQHLCHDRQPFEEIENQPSKTEVESPGNGSRNLASTSKGDCQQGQGRDVPLTNEEANRQSDVDTKVEISSASGRSDSNTVLSSDERRSKENSEFQPPTVENLNQSNGQELQAKTNSDNHNMDIDDKTLTLNSESNGNSIEVMENDDKENAAASDENIRGISQNISNIERKTFGKHETAKGLKTRRATGKDASINATTSAAGLKHIKPKPTNPKPFRLRTDERRILKEANSEKKLDVAPFKEITLVTTKLPRGRSLKKDKIHNEKSVHQTQCTTKKDEENEEKKRQQRDQLISSSLKNSKQRVRQRLSSLTPQRHTASFQRKLVNPRHKHNEDKVAQKLGKLRRTKSPSVRHLGSNQGILPSMKGTIDAVTPCHLSVIRECSPTNLASKESTKRTENGTQPLTKASASASTPSSVQEKRFTTIPKEPNFHTMHVPKSCTKRALGHC